MTVPDVTNMTQATAQSALTSAGLTMGEISQEYSNTVPAGYVISQSPVASASVTSGTAVYLTISLGPQVTIGQVPYVLGLSQADAQTALNGAGFTVGTITQTYSTTVPAGNVISQSPDAFAWVAMGTAVSLTVSLGPQMATVPNVVGMTQFNAQTAITSAGLAMGEISQEYNNKVPVGHVISQNLLPGVSVVSGTAMSLTLSLGLPGTTVTVPYVVGLLQSDAQTAITGAGLIVGTVSQANSNTVPSGSVIIQNPLPYEKVATGTAVNITISLGPLPSGEYPWTMFHHDLKHTGLSPYTGAQTATVKWTFTTGGIVSSNPAIDADGTVYMGSYDGNVYAFDGATGTQKWASTIGNPVESSPAIGADGTVYVGSWDNNVYALDRETGTKKWTFTTGGQVISSPVIGGDGTVYVGSVDGKVYALDGDTGTPKWEFRTGNGKGVSSSPAIGIIGVHGPNGIEGMVTVYVGCDDGVVYALNGATGGYWWGFKTDRPVISSPAIGADGTVYVGSMDGKVYALDGATGTQKWAFTTGNGVESSPAIGADGTVYVGSDDGNVYALDGADGTQKWAFTTGNAVDGSPAIGADGTVYVGSEDGKVYALNGATGTLEWSFMTGGPVFLSSPAIGADGTVYVGSKDFKVYAFGTITMPDVFGMTEKGAEGAIKSAGITWGISENGAYSDTIPAGSVISQNPFPGASVTSGTAVTITVSFGPQTSTDTVPNVVGMTQAAAGSALTSAGLTVGTITLAYSSTVASGSVISSSPAAGASVATGTAVNLTISQGPSR